jgi:hypothetical protein
VNFNAPRRGSAALIDGRFAEWLLRIAARVGLRHHESKPYAATPHCRVVKGGLNGTFGIIAANWAVWNQKNNHVPIAKASIIAVTMLNAARPVMMPSARCRATKINTGKTNQSRCRSATGIVRMSCIITATLPSRMVRRRDLHRFKNNFRIRPWLKINPAAGCFHAERQPQQGEPEPDQHVFELCLNLRTRFRELLRPSGVFGFGDFHQAGHFPDRNVFSSRTGRPVRQGRPGSCLKSGSNAIRSWRN